MGPIWIWGMELVIFLDFSKFPIEVTFLNISTDLLAMVCEAKKFQPTELYNNSIVKLRLKSEMYANTNEFVLACYFLSFQIEWNMIVLTIFLLP